MSAQNTDLGRIQEMYDIIEQTKRSLEEIGITKERFLSPQGAEEELIVEGLESRVYRVIEEAGQMSEDAQKYGFDSRSMRGMRNIMAHAYGEVDHRIVWEALSRDFQVLADACQAYCADKEIELNESLESLKGFLNYTGPPVSLEEMDEAIAQASDSRR